MSRSEDKIGHIPKADQLNYVRDLLYLIKKNNNFINVSKLLELAKIYGIGSVMNGWSEATFNEYLMLMYDLKLIIKKNNHVFLQPFVAKLFDNVRWKALEQINDHEKKFFRDKFIKYKPFIRFLEVVFCNNERASNFNELINISISINGRKNVLFKWMRHMNIKDNRDPRVMLSWGIQTNIINKDEYTDSYFLVYQKIISYKKFLNIFLKSYNKLYTRDMKRVKVPDIRIEVCKTLHMPLNLFDVRLKEILKKNPRTVLMDRATSIRDEVKNFAININGEYYYYLNVQGEELK